MDDRTKKDKRAIAKNEHKGSKLEYMSKKNRPQKDRRTGEKVVKSAPLNVVELPEDMVRREDSTVREEETIRTVMARTETIPFWMWWNCQRTWWLGGMLLWKP